MNDTPAPAPPVLPTIQINPSAIQAVAISLAVSVSFLVSAFVAIVSFVKNRDLAGAVNWIKGHDFLELISALTTIATFGVIVWRALKRKWREVYLARHVDDEIAVVKAPTPPPSVEDVTPIA